MSKEMILTQLTWILGGLVVAALFLAFLPRHRLPWLRRFVLKEAESSSDSPSLPPLGTEVFAATAFRPFGKILLDGMLFSASSEGDYIEKDVKLTVVGHRGNQLIVKVR